MEAVGRVGPGAAVGGAGLIHPSVRRTAVSVLGAATIVAALGLSGCGDESHPAATSTSLVTTTSTSIAAAPASAPLPPPTALTDVLYRLADTSVPGADKVGLVEHATAGDAAALDRFGRALQDGGFTPLTFEARNVAWAQATPGDVVATIVVKAPNRQSGGDFTFPMEFTPVRNTWQLTRQTADLLLELGEATSPTPTR